jgi:hypothetical protein
MLRNAKSSVVLETSHPMLALTSIHIIKMSFEPQYEIVVVNAFSKIVISASGESEAWSISRNLEDS